MSVSSAKQQVFQHQAHMTSASSSMQQMAPQQSGLYQPHGMEQNMQQQQQQQRVGGVDQQQQHRFHQPKLPAIHDPLKIYTTQQQQGGVMSSQPAQQQQQQNIPQTRPAEQQMHNQAPKQEATTVVSQVSMNPSQMFEQRTYTATMGHNTATPHNLPANSFVFQQQQQQQQQQQAPPPVYDVHAAGQLSNVGQQQQQQQKMMTSNQQQQQVSMKPNMQQQSNKGMHNQYFPGGGHQQQQQQQQQIYDQRQQQRQPSSSSGVTQQQQRFSNAPPPITSYSQNPQASMAYNIPKNTSSSSSHMRASTTTSPSKKHRSSTDSRGHHQQQQQHQPPHQQQRSSASQQQQQHKKHSGGNDWQSLMMQAKENANESLYGASSSTSSRSSSHKNTSSEHHKTPKKSKEASSSSSSNHPPPPPPPPQQSSQRDHSESPSRHSKSSRSRYVIPSLPSNQTKKKGIQFVRVQFKQDLEIADIYKLKDVHYPDDKEDKEVASFDELQPGTKVIAKWPRNGKFYAGTVIDPNAGGRRNRERKPVKPFQADTSSVYKKHDQSISKMDSDDDTSSTKHGAKNADDDFNAYRGLSEKIKHKRSDKQRSDVRKAKKRKNPQQGLILLDSDEEDAPAPPPKKSSRFDEEKKYERRNAVETRFQQQDGVGPYNRFMAILERIFEKIDSLDPKLLNEIMSNETDDLPKRLISRSRLEELNEETIKLKNLGTLHLVPRKKLVKLLTFLVPVIRDGINLKPMVVEGKHTEEQKYNREHKLERVYCATEAALVALNVMTSPCMSKTVYIDEVMERAAQLLRKQLNNTVYPEYDPVYKLPTTGKKGGRDTLAHTSSRMKRAHYKGTKNRRILCLYNKLNSLLSCWVDLVKIIPMTDTTILQVAPIGISPFFVENVKELQLSAIRLTTTLFAKYERHRKHILDDIFESMARLPTSKRNLRSYRLNYAEEAVASSDDEEEVKETKSKKDNLQYIQMVSALILQMIQAIIQLPSPVHKHMLSEEITITEVETSNELKMVGSYDMARTTTHKFLAAFLKKCSSKSEDTDFRPLFENFLHDLLNTVNKPEWPASEMVLTVLGKLLVLTFSNKSSEMSLRVASLDYLGVVAAKLRRDALSGRSDGNTVRALMKRLEETVVVDEQEGVVDEDKPLVMDEPADEAMDESGGDVVAKPSKKVLPPKKNKQPLFKQRLMCLVLGYLRNNMQADQSLSFALNFYVGQWHRDVTTEYQMFQKSKGKDGDSAEENKQSIRCQKRKGFLLRLSQAIVMSSMSRDERDYRKWSDGVSLVMSHQEKSDRLARALGNEDATQLTRYLASYRSFSRSFDTYLSYILKVCEESAVALRTRAIKCLAEVVAVDPSIMTRDDISRGVRMSLMDSSTNVREAAVDLIGRFIILKPDLVPQYYEMLTSRILDTGVSVRKRVIRILRDLCHEHPHLPQLTDACVRMIRRVNDEDGIKKLVHEVFMKMWFTPIDENDHAELKKKALLITDIVAANRNRGYEWIEQLFKNLIDTTVENPKVEKSCRQVVDCLVQHVILFENERDMGEEKGEDDEEKDDEETEGEEKEEEEAEEKESKRSASKAPSSAASSTPQNLRLIATIQTLGYLAKIRPMYLVKHVMLLQPYLATKCDTADDLSIVQGVCKILELAVPLMHRPSETFLATLEAEMMKIILTHRYRVVTTAVTCLSAIVTSFTQNYKLVWDCFQRMCNGVSHGKVLHQRNPRSLFTPVKLNQLHRALFVIGHLSKTFDFDDEILKGRIEVCVKDKVYDCIFYFCDLPTTKENEQLKVSAVTSLGLLMIQDPDMMFRTTSRVLYKDLLANNQKSVLLKVQVLQNLQIYLQTEDMKQQEAAIASVKKLQQLDTNAAGGKKADLSITDDLNEDNIKEICDVSSGMSSSVMQLFLREVLDSFCHKIMLIRRNALHTISLTLNQGLVHPNQCVPYLIAATSDPEPVIYKEADQQLNDLSKKYSGFVHTNANAGINMSYKLHKYIMASKRGGVIRGYAEMSQLACDETAKYNKAYCSHLYQIVRSDRKHRRTFIHSLLRLFDDTVKTDMEKLIFVADNLAYFPYQTVDEPLFLMHAIEVFVSVSGSNVLQAFKEALSKCKNEKKRKKSTTTRGSDEEEDPFHQEDYSMSSSSSSESEEDEDNGGELNRMSSMEEDAIEEFAHHSLACLLLLWLKDFLKSIYGFTDNKIHKYSPTEKNRANEKQCHRRKNENKILMQVAPASQHVLRVHNRVPFRSSEFRRAVNKQYYQLKELMNKLDPNEEDSSSDEKNEKKPTTTSSGHHNTDKSSHPTHSTTNHHPDEDSDRDTDGEMPKPKAPLDLIRQSTALKDRKKLRKSSHTRIRIKYAEADTESSDDSDFKGF